MKKSALPLALLLLGVTLSGCPVYDSADSGCFRDIDCPYGYLCDGATGACFSAPGSVPNGSTACSAPSDCGTNETCSRSGTCMAGDCHFASVGCVRGYDCSSDSGRWECVKPGTGAGGAAAGGGESDAGSPASSAGAPNVSTGGAPEPASAAGAGG